MTPDGRMVGIPTQCVTTCMPPLNDGDTNYPFTGNIGDPAGQPVWEIFVAGSAHTGGMNAVFADGGVRTVNYDIDLHVFNALGTRNGTSAGPGGPTTSEVTSTEGVNLRPFGATIYSWACRTESRSRVAGQTVEQKIVVVSCNVRRGTPLMSQARFLARSFRLSAIVALGLATTSPTLMLHAQSVTTSVNLSSTRATLPDYGMGFHTSVYDGALRHEGSPVFSKLDSVLDNAGIDVLRCPSGGYADFDPLGAGGSSVPEPACLLLVGVAWLCCGGLGVRRSQGPATTRHRFSCLAACIAIGTLLGMSQTAHAAEEDLLNDPLHFSGATLHIRPYAAMPSGFNDIIGMTYRPDDTRMYVTATEGTIFAINDNGAGTTSAVPWFNASAALQAATGRSMNGNTGQQGLQSVAFHPDFGNVGTPGYGKLYTTMLENRPANPGSPAFKYLGNTTYGGGGGGRRAGGVDVRFNAGQVTTNSYRELFRVNMPNYDHPIKQAKFNPHAQPGDEDYGLLYMTHGDSNNQDSLNNDPQDRGDLMGKMIRINPLQSGANRYTIPATNPFASSIRTRMCSKRSMPMAFATRTRFRSIRTIRATFTFS